MSSSRSEIEINDGYLLYKDYGTRNNLQDIIAEAKGAYDACLEHKCDYLLCDFRNVTYNIQFSDAFNIIRIFEQHFPYLQNIIVAHVTSKEHTELAEFWKSLGNQRGYNIEVFSDIEKGKKWLIQQLNH